MLIKRFTVELIKGALNASRREMKHSLHEPQCHLSLGKDFFTAILNPQGELVVSTSLTLAGNLIDSILDSTPLHTMKNGDLYYNTMTHISRVVQSAIYQIWL